MTKQTEFTTFIAITTAMLFASLAQSAESFYFMIKDADAADPHEVVVTLPVLGAYSETWPLNCPRSAKIVRNMAAWESSMAVFPSTPRDDF